MLLILKSTCFACRPATARCLCDNISETEIWSDKLCLQRESVGMSPRPQDVMLTHIHMHACWIIIKINPTQVSDKANMDLAKFQNYESNLNGENKC